MVWNPLRGLGTGLKNGANIHAAEKLAAGERALHNLAPIEQTFGHRLGTAVGSNGIYRRVARGMKGGALVLGGVAAVGAIGMLASVMRGKRHPHEEDYHSRELEGELPPVVTGRGMAPVMPDQLAAGPAEGHGPTEWQDRMRASRGQQIGNAGPGQPRMNVVEGPVQDLGPVRQ